jgi:CRISPR-associated protein Csm1
MTENQQKIVIGSLLHDIGKVLYQDNKEEKHSEKGYDFLRNEIGLKDRDILDQIRYHHSQSIQDADIENDSFAYITYMADNISSGLDRRKKEDEDGSFVQDTVLESIFNILNRNNGCSHYRPIMLDQNDEINFPTEETISYDEAFYKNIIQKLKDCLEFFSYSDEYIHSLLEILEQTLSFVPSAKSQKQMIDISLYDHVKLTAAIASCIYQYLQENIQNDYKDQLYVHADEFYDKKVFLIYSMDISGIQDFIYTINSKGALKGLRARSFYLEIMMEHLIDELLAKTGLSRTNLIYSGGGHAYLLMANTDQTKKILTEYENEINRWFLQVFQTALYVGTGYTQCSTKDLEDQPSGSYEEIFRKISKSISSKKIKRYGAKDIIWLNTRKQENGERECIICRRSDHLRENNHCEICWTLEQMSTKIMNDTFFIVGKTKENISLPLPGDYYLTVEKDEKAVKKYMGKKEYVRAYSKNVFYSGYSVVTKLWIGDYQKTDRYDFPKLAQDAQGIERIAVLRADIDNLGEAFVSGFKNEKNNNRYVTISRTATFSRKLSLFFKYHVNHILQNGQFYLKDKDDKERCAVVVYSGGDDLFVVGSWDDVIGFAVDLYNSLKKYAQGTLTISGGIGLYSPKYPIASMAKQTGELEDAAKGLEGKNAISLFDARYTFHWDEFIDIIIQEKFELIKEYLENFGKERGKAFLYRILSLIRATWDDENGKINIARFAYQLARIEPDKDATDEQRKIYNEFSKSMYQWIKNKKDAKQLELAIYLYVYLLREKEGRLDED